MLIEVGVETAVDVGAVATWADAAEVVTVLCFLDDECAAVETEAVGVCGTVDEELPLAEVEAVEPDAIAPLPLPVPVELVELVEPVEAVEPLLLVEPVELVLEELAGV